MTCFTSRPDVIPFPFISAQFFYSILVQHLANLSGASPVPAAHLDAMTTPLLLMTSEVPFYAAPFARAASPGSTISWRPPTRGPSCLQYPKALARPCSKQQHRALVAGQQGGNAQDSPTTSRGESPWPRSPDRCFNSSSSQSCSPRATGAIRSCHRHACRPGGRCCSASLLISARRSGGSLWHGSPCTWRPLSSGTARV